MRGVCVSVCVGFPMRKCVRACVPPISQSCGLGESARLQMLPVLQGDDRAGRFEGSVPDGMGM